MYTSSLGNFLTILEIIEALSKTSPSFSTLHSVEVSIASSKSVDFKVN